MEERDYEKILKLEELYESYPIENKLPGCAFDGRLSAF
jgi:hypothetical protein